MSTKAVTSIMLILASALILPACQRTHAEETAVEAPSMPPVSVQPTALPENPAELTVQLSKVKEDLLAAASTEEPSIPAAARRESTLKPLYAVSKGTVAITIDDGPTKDTGKLLKVLKEKEAKVTFFFLGQHVEKYHESVTQAVYEGHGIGYHSDTHPQMTKMTYETQEQEFDSGLQRLQKYCKIPVLLFRPPYGSYNNDTKIIVEDRKMSMVLWNEDPKDWESSDADQITKKVLSQVKSGSVIVMHDHPSTIEALPDIIDGIRDKGYKLVTIPAP